MSLASFFSSQEIDLSFNQGCLSMTKGADGDYHLMCQYSNRWRDRDTWAHPKGGEILTREAHEKYMDWLNQNPNKAPELWSLHIPGTQRKNIAHWWGFDGNFSYAEFKLTPEEALAVKRFTMIYKAGLSHGFFVLKYSFDDGLIEEYITYEISILPIEMAANQWTSISLIQKELLQNMYLRDDQRAALVALHGEDFVKDLETKSQALGTMLDTVGIDSKALKTRVQETVDEKVGKTASKKKPAKAGKKEEAAAGEAAAEETTDEVVTVTALETIQQDIMGALQRLNETLGKEIKALKEVVDEQATEIEELQDRLGEVEEDDGDRIEAAAAAAPKSIFAAWMPGSVIGADETIVEGKERKRLTKGPKQAPVNKHMLSGMFQKGGGYDEDEDEE